MNTQDKRFFICTESAPVAELVRHTTFNRAVGSSSLLWCIGKGEIIMPTIDMLATGNNIKRLRDKSGLTTKDIMDILGFNNPNAIYKWFRGLSLPTLDNLVILADIFGVNMDDIIVIRRNIAV